MLVLDEKELDLERKRLTKTNKALSIVLDSMSERVLNQKIKVKEFQKYAWENRGSLDVQELAVIRTSSEMEANILLREQRYFLSLRKSKENPYFGSIIFKDKNNKEHLIYIGMTYLVDINTLDNIIHDWRSPICSLFYDFDIGECFYNAPIGIVEGELKRKRQYNIKGSKLVRMFDNSVNISDDILQEVLEKESSEKMENIVNTIQKEQNYIIRGNEYKNVVIQGVAGSGKTSVALHRIAFLLYKLENLTSRDILIFSPNNVFTEYISNVLPELGEENTLQTTFNDYLYNVITEYKHIESFSDFISRYYMYNEPNIELVKYKQSDKIIDDIDKYIKNFISKAKFEKGIIFDEIEHNKDELNELLHHKYDKYPLFSRIQEISNKLCENDYKGNRRHAKTYGRLLKEVCNYNINIKKIYYDFFVSPYCSMNITEKEISKFVNGNNINYEDALLFTYMKSSLFGFHYEPLIKQVVIDEAQDYNKLQFLIIRKIFKKSNFTILGDVNQTINPYYKYDNLNILNNIFIGTYIELNKSYRSSAEIINYSNSILNLGEVEVVRKKDIYPIIERDNIEMIYEDIDRMTKTHKSLALITKDDQEASNIHSLLKDKYKVTLIDKNSKEFSKNLVIIPSYLSKGLEFDSVILLNKSKYKEDEKYLLYVASSRAQHELVIYN